ncbi:error-prone DNA polymerase [Caldimonas brevitalea]|uniref:Error-prone DNA polymerase n=1 Tax=Caldimonas brevitalea TaxID=413882 RepID=A0A0G3BS35_9BURK|nr:error-prone DNA polymerase [Caldimonas brevitalea]AKJ30221.1 DNA polymerase [Caldimonas brevitalea]
MSGLLPAYAELHCLSNFTFLRGASHAEQLVERAKALGYSALAITDECSLAGIVRAHLEAKDAGLKLLVGAEFEIQASSVPFKLVVLACNRQGYGNLSAFITRLRRTAEKGDYQRPHLNDLRADELADCVVLYVPGRGASFDTVYTQARWFAHHFELRAWLAVELLHGLDDTAWLHKAREVSRLTGLRLVAAGDVHMHVRSRKPLQDTLTAIRVGKPLTECGFELQPNAERHLRSRLRLAQIYPADLLDETVKVAERCTFSLDELKYEYPQEIVPPGETPAGYLRRLTYEGAGRRYQGAVPQKVSELIENELALIAELQYEAYFLTVYDLVAFARSRHILCQGRGSAANSAVAYCLGITSVDPARSSMLFERFISRERNEPPDIDVDFEHQRREEVIQYIYEKYGRDRAGLTAVVSSYRPKSAIRDVGKALGFDLETVDRLAKHHQWWDGRRAIPERLQECGLDLDDLATRQLLALLEQIIGFPRHLSQHVGGFVIAQGQLSRMVPVENAAMPERTVIQWDKDDLDAMGLLKVDVLALGMLSAIQRALDFIGERRGHVFELQDVPPEDAETYRMIQQADTVGVFQIESRAQMAMLPRMKPERFYDLVIEVALVRPGPIQGGMVHPYLRRRQGLEEASCPPGLERALGRTLGVPIFQEQVMQIAQDAAGFTAGEADQLRRAMAAWKRKGGVQRFYDKIIQGMTERGYDHTFAEQIFAQIQGFAEYGFPESHAASFALLVYASCWIKRHEPAAFLAALLNSQPMGFYAPSQLVQDARRHGVEVRPPDVMYSEVESTLEDLPHEPAVRIGLQLMRGLKLETARRIVAARHERPFDSAEDLARRARVDVHEMRLLAGADALLSLSGHRRQQVWDATALTAVPELLEEAPFDEEVLELPAAPEGEEVVFDYASLGLTLRSHPLALLRPRLREKRLSTAEELRDTPNGRLARACGIVTMRQQPSTANGVIFVTLEDETGQVNVIVWRSLRDSQRKQLLHSRLLAVYGVWQRDGEVRHLVAHYLEDLTPWLGQLQTDSRDFR